jgi:hypothetical protein
MKVAITTKIRASLYHVLLLNSLLGSERNYINLIIFCLKEQTELGSFD